MAPRRKPNPEVNDVVDRPADDVTEANRRISRPDTEADAGAERLLARAVTGGRAGATPAVTPPEPEGGTEDEEGRGR